MVKWHAIAMHGQLDHTSGHNIWLTEVKQCVLLLHLVYATSSSLLLHLPKNLGRRLILHTSKTLDHKKQHHMMFSAMTQK